MVAIDNYARKEGTRRAGTPEERSWYRWRLFVAEPDSVLDTIESVEYLLHPTFPSPYQVTRNRDDRFALEGSGWGSFTVNVTVNYRDGDREEKEYFLDLGKPWPE
ncbi:MAG: pYEATS domain-containing protein [Candidatus Bathyarchaeota archaeon]